ncbi:TIGR03088 family PEP-CTERM/XrtA system glycosyltransferase [Zooshikella sp. RANM57]|uniref:TIGR03088 family PEP-CTERM/XrtA system glycosyltransferase n=1 Tax=Zooshikella sp. RANM57 TaxID=3425863 RepID=UPI003D6F2F03
MMTLTHAEHIPLIAHLVFRLDVGGLENGLVNLINRIPVSRYRHAIICMTDYSDFAQRIKRSDVEIIALHKKEGQDWKLYYRLWKALRQLKPDYVHTRNIATLEGQFIAWLAGVRYRIHGEHGWDVYDVAGSNKKYQWLRRLMNPFVKHYIALSSESRDYLINSVGVAANKVAHIYNGVDTDKFSPQTPLASDVPESFTQPGQLIIGTVGRLAKIKHQQSLLSAFIELKKDSTVADTIKLVLVGDGPEKAHLQSMAEKAGVASSVWFAGVRQDIPQLMRRFAIFVLPSLAEGISNTILEAMASGLPVVATDVGGNSELIQHQQNGMIVPVDNVAALAEAIHQYLKDTERRKQHGLAARQHVVETFSMDAMVNRYTSIYDQLQPN